MTWAHRPHGVRTRGDIGQGVLDLVVQFPYKGQHAQCYLLHFFPVDTVAENVKSAFPNWTVLHIQHHEGRKLVQELGLPVPRIA